MPPPAVTQSANEQPPGAMHDHQLVRQTIVFESQPKKQDPPVRSCDLSSLLTDGLLA
ncbi:hypothetical protein RHCRD62_30580 [Rhodococcus sp. RD6.2]|nr:hypothetical protein RHCRD62_30580 [Rhodococcus sp. RD6.2]